MPSFLSLLSLFAAKCLSLLANGRLSFRPICAYPPRLCPLFKVRRMVEDKGVASLNWRRPKRPTKKIQAARAMMTSKFLDLTVTDSVRKAQDHYYGKSTNVAGAPDQDALTEDEKEFIRSRDSFYMATVTETGWPYLQHRGGAPGFLRVVGPNLLAFADYKGNRQMLSTGNVAANDRVTLFLMDYPSRNRLKIMGHARVEDARAHPELIAQFAEPAMQKLVERIFFIEVVGFNWNCSQYITPRYTAAEVKEAVAPLKTRIAELEAKLANPSAP